MSKDSCWACRKPIRSGERLYKHVEGWVRIRRGGGANEVALRKDLGDLMHEECMMLLKRGITPGQISIMTDEDEGQPSLLGDL